MATSDQTVNIPQLLIVLLLGGLAIRYFFFSNSAAQGSGGRNGGSGGSNGLRAREVDVERIQQMFPQVARRTIMWDLQRNGGNVVATTERVLSGRGLEEVSRIIFLC
jgi:coupling of ubiquitin conjugation to ER degradation protein 1